MCSRRGLAVLCTLPLLAATGCGWDIRERPTLTAIEYKHEVKLGKPFQLSTAPFQTGGFPSNEQCMEGAYTHVYEMQSALYGSEVWLCCVPVDELLRESFWCAGGLEESEGTLIVPSVLGHLGSADDLKIRYCMLYDATAEEQVLIPACIEAPLEAPPHEWE